MALPISELLEPTGVPLLTKIQGLPKGTLYTVGDENPIKIEFTPVKNETSGLNRVNVGRGVTKTAYNVTIRSGDASGQGAILLTPIIAGTDKTFTKTVFDNQQKAHALGYAPKPYTYSLTNKGIIVSERVRGENICRMRGLTDEQQFAIMKATLELHMHKLYQLDTNCGNYYIDGNTTSIIDDIETSDTYTLLEVLRILMTIQRTSKFKMNKFARYMHSTNNTYLLANKRTAPLQGLVPGQIAEIGEDFYNRAIELFKPYDIAELASTIKDPDTYFRLNGGVYTYIRTEGETLICKRLGEDRRWSTDESRIEINNLIDIPINGIFRCNTPVIQGGGKRTTRKSRLLPTRRKNVRKSVRGKHS